MTRSNVSLKSAITLIASDKVKDRIDGQELLREIFSVRANCETLSSQPDNAGWLHVFQQCFGAVMLERAAAVKPGKASSTSNGGRTRGAYG